MGCSLVGDTRFPPIKTTERCLTEGSFVCLKPLTWKDSLEGEAVGAGALGRALQVGGSRRGPRIREGPLGAGGARARA